MQRSSVPKFVVMALALSLPTTLFADFTYQETTQMTGGSMLSMMKMAGAFSAKIRKIGDPVVSSIYIHGNRMARVNADEVEVIDLDAETITHIDPNKRTYSVVTFQQMRDQAAKARQEMEKRQSEHPQSAPAANPDAENVKMSYDVHVRNTGAVKQVSGLEAKEAILTMMMNATDQKSKQTGTMAVTNDMWMVPEIPGYGEVRDFYMKYAAKMGTVAQAGGVDMSAMMAQNPGASQAMAGMAQEMQKLKGVPVMQVMRMGTTTDGKPLLAASEAPLPPDNSPSMPSGGDIAKQSAAGMLTSHFGLGGFGRKKQNDPPAEAKADPNAKAPTSAVLMETQTAVTNFSSAPVDHTHFEVPNGFKLVTR